MPEGALATEPRAAELSERPENPHEGIIAAFALGRPTRQERHEEASEVLLRSGIDRLKRHLADDETVYVDRTHHLVVRLATNGALTARRRMQTLTGSLVRRPLHDVDGPAHVDVGSAWTRLSGEIFTDAAYMREVSNQADQSLWNRDLVPRAAVPTKPRRKPSKAFIPFLTALSILLTFAVPLAIMMSAYLLGTDISGYVYFALVGMLLIMSATQLAEGFAALRKNPLPAIPDLAAPPASAIVAAYLPNEAATIIETLRSMLAQSYAGDLQVILAYNTPEDLPIEDELRALAQAQPRLELLRVAHSRSKADNVNAALAIVTGEFVGIFDADHHPMDGSFDRAWRWFADGADIVQGHCVVRNGEESGIARLVAVEFEQIYTVSHPGRQRLHHFGIFGGSNGYWRTQLLHETRLRSQFLTEDIDSSIRAVRIGAKIINDPGLISRELAPVNLSALWKQRMRWAQGWFEVSLRHGHAAISRSGLSLRQRYGLWMLLGWREIFPWVASLMWPTLAFFIWRDDGLDLANAPQIFWLTTAFTITTGPILVAFAYRLGAPEIRQHRSWWWQYVFASVFVYSEFKNVIVRVAQMRHLLRQNEWVVTPRGHVDRKSARN